MSTFMAKAETIERKWYVIDAAGKPVGKTAVAAANILRGKHRPEFGMEQAVKGMLPKNTLGAKSLTRLRVYAGAEHEQAAQKPVAYEV